MAYIRKAKNGRGYRAEVEKLVVRVTGTFPTKAEASNWAAQREAEILAGAGARWPRKTVADAIGRYIREVTPGKGSARNEQLRLEATLRNHPALAGMLFADVQPADLAAWRDARLAQVTKGSVQREINTLRNVWTIAGKEWGWCSLESPWRLLRMPGDNPARQAVMGWREVRLLMRRCHFRTGRPPSTAMEGVAWALLVALRTAMRAGEVLSLTAETVDLHNRVATLHQHKLLHITRAPRVVPLTPQGVRVLRVLLAKPGSPWPLDGQMLDALFRKVRRQLMLPGLQFRDSRATALTHMSRRYDPLTLVKISGHLDLSEILDTYYRESPQQIAARLAQPRPGFATSATGGAAQSAPRPVSGSRAS